MKLKKEKQIEKKCTSKTIKTATLSEARLLMFSGWSGRLEIETESWGKAVIGGPGLNQNHADFLDYMRSFPEKSGPTPDNSGRYILAAKMTDFYRMKGLDPQDNSKLVHKLAKDLKATSFDITTKNGGRVSFNMLDLCGYDPERHSEYLSLQEMTAKKDDKSKFAEGSSKGVKPLAGIIYGIRYTKEYLTLISGEAQVDYSALLPEILALSKKEKMIIRFFLTHRDWIAHSTTQLAEFLYPDHTKELKEKYRMKYWRQEKALIECVDGVKKFGIEYNSKTDKWTYKQHPAVTFVYPPKQQKIAE